MSDVKDKSFTIYLDKEVVISELTDEELGKIFRACFYYQTTRGIPPDLQGHLRAIFRIFQIDIDRDHQRYVATIKRNRANGQKGGRPRKSEQDNEEPIETEQNPQKPSGFSKNPKKGKDKDKTKDKDNNDIILVPPDGEPQPKPSRFEKPTIDTVNAYIKEKGLHVDGEKFWNYYESNGWKVGRNPMKSWRSALVTWERSDKQKNKAIEIKQSTNKDDYTW